MLYATPTEREIHVKKLFSLLLALLALLSFSGTAAAADEESDVIITKNPGGEIVTEGDDALFISRARNYTGLIWLIVSPDGETVYENNKAVEVFPGLEMSGFEGEELTLTSIPYAMDGWYVQTRFLDARGRAALTDVAKITVLRGDVPSPSVTPKSAGARLSPGQTKTLTVEAVSPGGDELKYQWYKSYSIYRNSGEAILGATGPNYTPEEEIGQVFYYVGVWCVRGRETSAPIFTAPIAIVYTEAEPTPAPAATATPAPESTPPANRGGANPLFNSGNALAFAIGAIAALTVLAVTVTALVLRAIGKKQDDDEEDDEAFDPDEPE